MSVMVGCDDDDAVVVDAMLLEGIDVLLNLHVEIVAINEVVPILGSQRLVGQREAVLYALVVWVMHRHGEDEREERTLRLAVHP